MRALGGAPLGAPVPARVAASVPVSALLGEAS